MKFDVRVDQLAYSKMKEYMVVKSSNADRDHVFSNSVVHLKRGIFMTAGIDNKLRIWIPGRSHSPNFLGMLEEENVVSNLTVFGQHLKKKKNDELQVLYTAGNYIKLLSFKTLTSMIVYKNLKEITCMCIVQQNPNIISFGTTSGAIKEYDLKAKEVVRSSASRHKQTITCLHSFGKYLVSCSSFENLIVVYDYQKQEEYISLNLKEQNLGLADNEQPTRVSMMREQSRQLEFLIIGTSHQ